MKKSHYSLLIPATLMAAGFALSANSSVAFAEKSRPIDSHLMAQPNGTVDKANQP